MAGRLLFFNLLVWDADRAQSSDQYSLCRFVQA